MHNILNNRLNSEHFSPGPASTVLAVLLLCLLPSLTAFAQSFEDLDRLVFDPVLLDPETGAEVTTPDFPLQLLPLQTVLQTETPVELPDIDPVEIAGNIDQYEEAVSQLVADEGPFTHGLYQTLVDLGTQYQMLGDHELAIETFQRAEYVSRINNGLDHPEQFSSIEKMIDSYMAIGDVASANEKRRYMVYLSEKHYGLTNLNTLPTLISMADQNMQNFSRVMSMPVMPTISISSGNNPMGGGTRELSPRQMAFGSLFTAQQNYSRAISTMINNQLYFDPMLLELEYRLLETLLLQSFRSSIIDDPDYYLSNRRYTTGSLIKRNYNRSYAPGYVYGKIAFDRIIIYIRNNPEAKVYQLVNALMEYGDWNMLFGRSNSAQIKYREAYDVVQEIGIDQASVDQIFRPEMPVHLPLITAKPNSREKFGIPDDAELEYLGHIDMEFTISRFGRARSFDIVGSSGNVERDVERRLMKYLRNSPFRPRRQEDGSFKAERVKLRYYYTYADLVI